MATPQTSDFDKAQRKEIKFQCEQMSKQKRRNQEQLRHDKRAYYEAKTLETNCLGLNLCEMWAVPLITVLNQVHWKQSPGRDFLGK